MEFWNFPITWIGPAALLKSGADDKAPRAKSSPASLKSQQ